MYLRYVVAESEKEQNMVSVVTVKNKQKQHRFFIFKIGTHASDECYYFSKHDSQLILQ